MILESATLEDALVKASSLLSDGERLFILADEIFRNQIDCDAGRECCFIEAGESNKNLDTLQRVWCFLSERGATRKSLLVCVGGGMITDIGGFAAATFKRGIRYVNIPTTILAASDASIGGKTGIDFMGLKNEIGAFWMPEMTLIVTSLFRSLPYAEVLSGFGEMIKTGFIESEVMAQEMLELGLSLRENIQRLSTVVPAVARVKERIVASDTHEKGTRKMLNLGHTIGHAFESLALMRSKPIPHGVAVAYGLLVEMILSHTMKDFPTRWLYHYAEMLRNSYPPFALSCDDYEDLINLMLHDKKNRRPGEINFTLLLAPGKVVIDETASKEEIKIAFDIFRDMLGI